MFLLKSQLRTHYGRPNLTYSVFKETLRNLSRTPYLFIEANTKEELKTLETIVNKYESTMLYNSTIESRRIRLGYKKNNELMLKKHRYKEQMKNTLASIQPLPVSLKYYSEGVMKESEKQSVENSNNNSEPVTSEEIIQFPYSDNYPVTDEKDSEIEKVVANVDKANAIDHEIRQRHELLKDMNNWMTSYDNFEHDLIEKSSEDENWQVNYGTPDPCSNISNVPCGGCGAFLHCKDTAIPGYIPSEIFKNHNKRGAANLEAIICQRCYFLKEFNMSLQVRVSPDDYPKILTTIQGKKALVVLMVDLMDFPCSIWPGIADILGPKTPIMIVGNKVDLLPKDDDKYLTRVKHQLLDHVKLSGFATCNILHTSLISAKTGYGVEDLITALHSFWKYRGDVYLVGCTNVGKSSLFNALLQSDYCKIQAADLIQRATTSLWPGTTLNLLKFPILRPSGHRLYLRYQRMMTVKQVASEEERVRSEQVKTFNSPKFATLIGHIGQTFSKLTDDEDEAKDSFATQGNSNASGKLKMGINENHPDYALSRWCFDTPGVVQPDQILHMLTAEELVYTLPRQIIRPETFCVKPGTSLFIAGLARLDYLDGPGSIRFTVFRSNELPVTICKIEEAGALYKDFVGTELFKVPVNNADRLTKWPGLEATKPFTITGTGWKTSCNDVVLSSAGWIALNCDRDKNYEFRAWTPEKRGIYIRDCLLPKAVSLRGARIRFSVAYKANKFI